MRTYVYKLTSDRGGAPCAPPPDGSAEPLLTLSICKPAIRRTAQRGDRLLGITSRALVEREGYAPEAVIYAARVSAAMDFGLYYAEASPFRDRPDCVYLLNEATGELGHGGTSPLHAEHAYAERDLGRAPLYRNARTLLCDDFRYFGRDATTLPARFPMLQAMAQSLGQGHRVFDERSPEAGELNRLFAWLWKQTTRYTPAIVTEESPGHAPRPQKS